MAQLRGARERKRAVAGKCEGRKGRAEINPRARLRGEAAKPTEAESERMPLRAISAELAAHGFLNENGRPFAASSVKSMLDSVAHGLQDVGGPR